MSPTPRALTGGDDAKRTERAGRRKRRVRVKFVRQGKDEDRAIEQTLDRARRHVRKLIDEFYPKEAAAAAQKK